MKAALFISMGWRWSGWLTLHGMSFTTPEWFVKWWVIYKAFQGDTRRCQHLPQYLFYKLVCKLPYMLVSQNLQVPFTSNFDQNFIISKGNDWYYFGLDYMTNEYFTDLSVKCIYFDLLKTPSLFDSFKMVSINYFSYEVPLIQIWSQYHL